MPEEKRVKVQFVGPLDQRSEEVGYASGESALMVPGKVYEVPVPLARSLEENTNFSLYGDEARNAVKELVEAERKRAGDTFVPPMDSNDIVERQDDGTVAVKAVPKARADELRSRSQERAKMQEKMPGVKAARSAMAESDEPVVPDNPTDQDANQNADLDGARNSGQDESEQRAGERADETPRDSKEGGEA